MELLIAVGIFGVSVGTIVGMLFSARHTDQQCEIAYLSGHVDGYTKAVEDSGEGLL